MKFSRFFCLFCLIVSFHIFTFAQTSPTESKEEQEKAQKVLEKKAVAILEQVVGEAALLKLSDNRALLYASAGDVLWKRDEKRARQLFRQSAQEIIQANNAPASTDTSPMAMMSFLTNPSPRKQILLTVAKYDPEMALELLYSTRPANVTAALAAKTQSPTAAGQKEKMTPAAMMENSRNKFLADDELRLEQSFSAQAAEKDPKKAAQLLRESIAKNGVTSSVFQILAEINAKDNELANDLAKEIGNKLLDSDFAKNETERNVVSSFLNQYYLDSNKPKDQTKTIKIEEKLAKDLANKTADYLLQLNTSKGFENYFQFRQLTPVIEKIAPERAALLKQKQAAMKKSMPETMSMFDDDAFGGNQTPDKMITSAAKMPVQMRGMMYKAAVSEAVTNETIDKARESLMKAPEGKERDDALAFLDSKIAESKIKKGDFEEARKIIDALSSNKEKIERIVQMAIAFYAKDTKEDKEFAVKLMDEARSLTDNVPQDEDAINDYLKVASGYAYVDPATAFSMLDSFSTQTNEIVNAAALLAKYDKRNTSFQNGEMVLTRGLPRIGNSVFRYGKELNLLANADIDRLRNMADRFDRPDARVLLKLYIVQAFFNEKIGLEGGQNNFGSSGGNITFAVEN